MPHISAHYVSRSPTRGSRGWAVQQQHLCCGQNIILRRRRHCCCHGAFPPWQAGPTSLPGSGRPLQTSPRASTALTNQPPQLEPPSRPNRATAMQSVFAMFIVHYQWPRFCVYNRTTVYAALPSQLVIMRHDCMVAEQPSDIVHPPSCNPFCVAWIVGGSQGASVVNVGHAEYRAGSLAGALRSVCVWCAIPTRCVQLRALGTTWHTHGTLQVGATRSWQSMDCSWSRAGRPVEARIAALMARPRGDGATGGEGRRV